MTKAWEAWIGYGFVLFALIMELYGSQGFPRCERKALPWQRISTYFSSPGAKVISPAIARSQPHFSAGDKTKAQSPSPNYLAKSVLLPRRVQAP
jgi:hypothetical protein